MAWLRKAYTPGSAPGGLVWNTPEDVVEVDDDDLAISLLAIPDAGFTSVAAPEPEKQEGDADAEKQSEGSARSAAKKTAASKSAAAKTPVQE